MCIRDSIEPRNLRQYVIAANRESALFEQVLIGMLGSDDSEMCIRDSCSHEEALAGADAVIFAVPSSFLRGVARDCAPYISDGLPAVSYTHLCFALQLPHVRVPAA